MRRALCVGIDEPSRDRLCTHDMVLHTWHAGTDTWLRACIPKYLPCPAALPLNGADGYSAIPHDNVHLCDKHDDYATLGPG